MRSPQMQQNPQGIAFGLSSRVSSERGRTLEDAYSNPRLELECDVRGICGHWIYSDPRQSMEIRWWRRRKSNFRVKIDRNAAKLPPELILI